MVRATKTQKRDVAYRLAYEYLTEGIHVMARVEPGSRFVRFGKWATGHNSYRVHVLLNQVRGKKDGDDFDSYADAAKTEVVELARELLLDPVLYLDLKLEFRQLILESDNLTRKSGD